MLSSVDFMSTANTEVRPTQFFDVMNASVSEFERRRKTRVPVSISTALPALLSAVPAHRHKLKRVVVKFARQTGQLHGVGCIQYSF